MKPKEKHGSALRWIWKVSGRGKKWIFLLILVKALQGIEGTLFALELRNVIDHAVDRETNLFLVHLLILSFLALSAIALNVLGQWWMAKSKTLIEKEIRIHVFSELMLRSYPKVSATHSGEWMMRITSDADVVVNVLLEDIPRFSGIFVQLTSALLTLFVMLPQAVGLLVSAGVVLAIFSILAKQKVKTLYGEVQLADGSMRSFMQEQLSNLMVTHTFTQEEGVIRQANEYADTLADRILFRSKFAVICSFCAYGMMRGGYLAGIILCCLQIIEGRMSYGTMAAILQLITRIDAPVTELANSVFKYFGMLASVDRLMEAESYPFDYPGYPHTLEKARFYYENQFAALGLRKAGFSYDNDKNHMVIKDFDVEINKGESIAFVGKSGCGKSTVLKLLMSLYLIQAGESYLRDTDGKEQELNAVWRGLFAYVPQGNYLVSGTIREAVTFGDSALAEQEEKIRWALAIACADQFVEKLPEGLDTVLGEHGYGLSEGQMQRIAIARAILSDRPILMLDESTSALDDETEKRLLMNLQTMTDRTVILVTHRSTVLEICKRKVEFEKRNE